ncbi:MAG TPA: MFS transporter [Gammaproteobacteria bacterium]|nr:MFS transporter [Gammaproteobacteria bacterium]
MNNDTLEGSLSPSKAIFLYCIVAFFLFFEMAIQVSPSVMSSQLMHDLNIGTFGLGIMSGIYFYTYTAMQIPSGVLFDRYNPRVIITLSILICVTGTFLFGLSQNIYTGSLARLLMGSGSAFAFVSVLVVTADLFKPRYFAAITGTTQMLAALGAMTGQMPISLLVTHIGWRNTLFTLSLIGLLLALIVWRSLNYKKSTHLIKSIAHESMTKTSLKSIIVQPQTWCIALYSCLLWAPMSSFASLWGVPFLKEIYPFDQTRAAFLCSLMWFGLAIASPFLGIISTSSENRVYPLAISALMGGIAFYLVLQFHFSALFVGLLLFIAGAACSGQALSFTVVKENNPGSATGTAIAFNNMAVVISGALFQPLIGKLLENDKTGLFGTYNIFHFKNVLTILFFAYLLSFLVALFFIKEPNNKNLGITASP